MDGSEITLVLPADPGFLHVARSAVGAIGATADLTYEAIEDLRLGVDEACTMMLARGIAPSIEIVFGIAPGSVEVTVRSLEAADPRQARWPDPAGEESFSWQVLKGLVEDLTVGSTMGNPWIRFSKVASPVP